MKVQYGILTLAVALAIAGCNSEDTAGARDVQSGQNESTAYQSPAYGTGMNDRNSTGPVANGTVSGPNVSNPNYNNGSPNYNGSSASANNTNTGNAGVEGMHQPLPDNPQAGINDKTPVAGLTAGDRQFIDSAMAGGEYEVSASSKAATHSDNQQIKTLAKDMVDDHSKADDQLQAIATRKGITAPIGITTDQTAQLAKLDQLNGAAFDAEFLKQQKKAHEDAISLFQTESTTGDARDLRDWAAATLPTLRNHLDMINNLSGNNNLGMAQ